MHTCMRVCMLSHFSRVGLFATLWTVAHQAALSGILQARIPEWVACPLPGESSRPRGRSHFSYVSCIGRQKQPGNPILYIQAHLIFSFDTLSRICVSTHIHVAESLRVQLKIYIHKCFHDFKKCENS